MEFKVYIDGKKMAEMNNPLAGAMILAGYSTGELRFAGEVVWTEHKDGDSANSYDVTAETALQRAYQIAKRKREEARVMRQAEALSR